MITDNIKEGEKDIFSPSSYSVEVKVDNEAFSKKLHDTLKRILTNEFSDSSKREIRNHRDRISFACVYCGDSLKDSKKKRGNIFIETLQYHCFNGDCNKHLSVYSFFKDKNALDEFSADECILMRRSGEKFDFRRIKTSLGLESFLSTDIKDLSVDKEFLMKKLGLVKIDGSGIEKYLIDRCQTDFHKFAWDPRKKILYIFNLTSDFSKIIGLQIKTFNTRNPYITWKISRIHDELDMLKEENIEKLEKLDVLSKTFGILQADLNKTVTVFEGPLDSFLFPNSLALCSAKNSLPFEIEGTRYFYDNDSTGKEWAIKRINEGSSVFLWRKYIEDNELILFEHKIKDLNDLIVLSRRTKKKFKKFVDYFSTDKYDIIYI